MAHGGRRAGAGRKPSGIKRVLYSSPIKVTEAKISERLPWLADKLFELAEGVACEKVMPDGVTTIVYRQPPDRQSIEYLMDRVMGRTTQPIDVSYQVDEIAADFGVEPARVTSIVERLKARRAG